MINPFFKKEMCRYCSRSIQVGQPIAECVKCTNVIHTRCFVKAKYQIIDTKCYCDCCAEKRHSIYNPFAILCETSNESNKFYDTELGETIQTIPEISHILDNCKSIPNFSQLNEFIKNVKCEEYDYLSTLFYNIDGNKSNFNEFLVYSSFISNSKISVFGLAETNTDESNKDLYNIPDYQSFYQQTYPNKCKGTGVALYLHNSLSAVKCDDLCNLSENLESLFITISSEPSPCTVDVMYRPPSGDLQQFLVEYNNILSKCPKNTIIMGDFNIDLPRLENYKHSKYEELVLTNGFYPSISTITHCKPGCRETCIDNIFINSPDLLVTSGTVEESISHHKPIFQISKAVINSKNSDANDVPQYYEFSNANIEKLCSELQNSPQIQTLSINSFSEFLDIFNEKVDMTCKLKQPKFSKRNTKNNSWIT